jgi:alpha-amylase/alpha-mannosidase (GH57 family)
MSIEYPFKLSERRFSIPKLLLIFLLLSPLYACGGDTLVLPPPTNAPHTTNQTDNGSIIPDSDISQDHPDDFDLNTWDQNGMSDTSSLDEGSIITDEAPALVNAVSQGGEEIVVRFSEPMAPDPTENTENFQILGSDNSELMVVGVILDEEYAFLTLDLNQSPINSDLTYTLIVSGVEDLTGNSIDTRYNTITINQPLYLNIIWHQHQPLYYDPNADQLIGPWVRKHATKDYWDMTAILQSYPDIHLTVNLTSVLLTQNEMYVERMGDFVDPILNTIDEATFLEAWEGRTDPFIDLLLRDTPTPEGATESELGLFYADPWATVSTSDTMMSRFPEYLALRDKARDTYNQLDFAYLKVFFEVAWFDPDFLQGPVSLSNGWVVDLSDVVDYQPDETYLLNAYYSSDAPDDETRLSRLELLANRLVAENYKIMADVIPLHRKMLWNPSTGNGQVEVITTPFYHPILPLIYNTELAQFGQPTDLLPNPPYQFADDAFAQVSMATHYYEKVFGQPLRGMWPGEGSVAEEIVSILVQNNVQWTATDQSVLDRSEPTGQSHQYPYRIDSDVTVGNDADEADNLTIVFRDTGMSDAIGFAYQTLEGEVAAEDFITNALAQAPQFGQTDRLLTVILDGENAWESYTVEHDGKGFHHALYQAISRSQSVGELITVTPSEFIDGNLGRNVPSHPVTSMDELEPLWRGSWIDGTYSIWIGESEENLAWNYLLQARTDLDLSGLPRPNPLADIPPSEDEESYAIYQAWNEIYAAEGSDWFWWYGDDMTSASNDDTPFDRAFRSHLNGMYRFMNEALLLRGEAEFPVPDFAPIIQARADILRGPFEVPPVIDGLFVPDETEWNSTAGSFYDLDSSGTIANASDDISMVYYGYEHDEETPEEANLYLAILFNEDLSIKVGTPYQVSIFTNYKHILDADLGTFEPDPQQLNALSEEGVPLNFIGGGAGWKITLDFSGDTVISSLQQANGDDSWDTPISLGGIELGGPVEGGRLLEVRIPYSALNMAFGDPFEFLVIASEGDVLVDQAPQLESQIIFDDVTNLVITIFEVDVSGSMTAIDTYNTIANPPPPEGSGIVYISGNQDTLANWYPNFISLHDDGAEGDAVAGDQIWSGSFGFRPGLVLRWKYTIGLPGDEGQWSNTEEFPLTERGYTLPDEPSTLYFREIFADRPIPTGSTAPNTEVDIE